jgi:hypothetical protein
MTFCSQSSWYQPPCIAWDDRCVCHCAQRLVEMGVSYTIGWAGLFLWTFYARAKSMVVTVVPAVLRSYVPFWFGRWGLGKLLGDNGEPSVLSPLITSRQLSIVIRLTVDGKIRSPFPCVVCFYCYILPIKRDLLGEQQDALKIIISISMCLIWYLCMMNYISSSNTQ